MKEFDNIIQFPVERATTPKPSERLRAYEDMTKSHSYAEVNGEIMRMLDKGNPIAKRLIASQIGEEIFTGLQVIRAMGMNLEDVATIVKETRAMRNET